MDHINQIVGQIRGRSPKIAATNRAQSVLSIIAYYCLLGVDEPVFQIQGRENKNPVTRYTAKPTSLEHLELEQLTKSLLQISLVLLQGRIYRPRPLT